MRPGEVFGVVAVLRSQLAGLTKMSPQLVGIGVSVGIRPGIACLGARVGVSMSVLASFLIGSRTKEGVGDRGTSLILDGSAGVGSNVLVEMEVGDLTLAAVRVGIIVNLLFNLFKTRKICFSFVSRSEQSRLKNGPDLSSSPLAVTA